MLAPTSPPTAAPSAKNGLSVGVEPSSLSRTITPVRCASSGCGPPNWSSGMPGPNGPVEQILRLAPATGVADDRVQLVVGSEPEHAAVMVAARGLAGVLLEGAEPDDRTIEHQLRAGPPEPVDPVGDHIDRGGAGAVDASVALAPEQVHEPVVIEPRVQGDAQQAALGIRIDRK